MHRQGLGVTKMVKIFMFLTHLPFISFSSLSGGSTRSLKGVCEIETCLRR